MGRPEQRGLREGDRAALDGPLLRVWLGELVGTTRDELAQVVRSCFGNSQELRELPKKLTLRAHYAAQELNRADRRSASRSW